MHTPDSANSFTDSPTKDGARSKSNKGCLGCLGVTVVCLLIYEIPKQLEPYFRKPLPVDITIVDETSHPLAGVTLTYEDKTKVPAQEVICLGYKIATSVGPFITHRKVRTVTSDASGHAHFELKWKGAALSASALGSDLHVFKVYSGGYGSDLLAYLADEISKGSGTNKDFSSQHANWTHFTVFVASFKRIREKAERGDPNAQYVLAWHLNNGYGVPQNKPEAFAWYRIAAKQNDDAKLRVSHFNQTQGMMNPAQWLEFRAQSDKYEQAFEAKIKSLAP